MDKDKINSVLQYLDIATEGEKINKIALPLLALEAICCAVFAERISFFITFSFSMVVFMIMLMWGLNINRNSKSLFLYLGVGGGLWSLCLILIAVGSSKLDLFYGCVLFIIMMLINISTVICLVKINARKILNVTGSCGDKKYPDSFYKVVGVIGMLLGSIIVKILSPQANNVVLILCGVFTSYGCLYMAIRCFYKHIIRKKYNLDELLKQQKLQPARKR